MGALKTKRFSVEKIKVDPRRERDEGDIKGLADSIDEHGMFHLPTVSPKGDLILGYRRWKSARVLGWKMMECRVAENADDVYACLRAERDENTQRKDLSPTEAVALAKLLEPYEREAAEGRRAETRNIGSISRGVKLTPREKGKSGDRVADAVGMSRATLTKADAVVEAAAAHPEEYADIAKKMDATGNVSAAYEELAERQTDADAPKTRLPHQPKKKPAIDVTNPVAVATSDAIGQTIPDALSKAWAAGADMASAASQARALKLSVYSLIPKSESKATPGTEFLLTGAARLRESFKTIETFLADAQPTIVCTRCKGEGCTHCHDLGYIVHANVEKHLKSAVADKVVTKAVADKAA